MINFEKVRQGISQCLMDSSREEYETQCYDCPYFGEFVTVDECKGQLLKDFTSMMKEQKEQKQKWLRNIADNQLDYAPNGVEPFSEFYMKQGIWKGLHMAYEILTGDAEGD